MICTLGKEIVKQRMGFREWMWRKGGDLKKNNLDHTEGSKYSFLHSRLQFSSVQSCLLAFYPTSKCFRLWCSMQSHANMGVLNILPLFSWTSFIKIFLVNCLKLSNILCSKFWYFSVSWRSNLQIIFHFTTHCQWPNYIMQKYYICICLLIYYGI